MEYKIETRCICGSKDSEEHSFGAVTIPIYQTATFAHPGIGQSTGYDYTRGSNPTRTELERVVSSMEGAAGTVACATGMAAISLCMQLFDAGDHIICSEDLYGGSVRIFDGLGVKHGCSFSYVDTADAELVENTITDHTRALYIETPSNPTMEVTDLAEMSRIAKKHGLWLIVDNTFMSPYLQNPIAFGADIVIHSGTKYLGGHNDTLSGFLCVNSEELYEKVKSLSMTIGNNLSPFDSFLTLRGIKTLAVRMERQEKNAMEIAKWLKKQPKIKQVYYVGLPEHPGHEINKKQARGFGAMISLRTDTEETAKQILERVKLISFAESLGGVESLITYPMMQTHREVPEEIRKRLGITETLLRLSVGIEHIDDLIRDLDQALNGTEEK